MHKRLITGRFGIIAGLLCLSAVSFAGGVLRGVYLDGKPVTAFTGVRYSGVDVEIGKDGIVRITTGPNTPRQQGERTSGRAPADTKPASPDASSGAGASSRASSAPTTTSPGVPSTSTPSGSTTSPAEAASQAPLPLEGRYWVALRDVGTPTGLTVRVQLNGQLVGEFASGEPRVIEVTSWLKRGENLARLDFRPTSPPGATSEKVDAPPAKSTLEVVLAPGRVLADQDQISLAYPIFTSRREAAPDPGPSEELRFVLPPPNLP